MRNTILFTIGLLLPLSTYAQTDDNNTSLYKHVLEDIQLEIQKDETELAVQRYAASMFHEWYTWTTQETGPSTSAIQPFFLQTEDDVSHAIANRYGQLCSGETSRATNDECARIIETITTYVNRASWTRALGRDLQMIATGYEKSIEATPDAPLSILPLTAGITYIWKPSNEIYIQNFIGQTSTALPFDEEGSERIEDLQNTLKDLLNNLIWEHDGKEDDTRLIATMHQYRHGVNHVLNHQGNCTAENTQSTPQDTWLSYRNCDVEEKLLNIWSTLIEPVSPKDATNPSDILFPSIRIPEMNALVWLRYDDVGMRPITRMEPVQAPLFPEGFANCFENGETPQKCYDDYENELVRGGEYPRFLDEEGRIVPEPQEGEGVCSHPFQKIGYLCRPIEHDTCTLNDAQMDLWRGAYEEQQDEDQNNEERTPSTNRVNEIVLTACRPQQYKEELDWNASGPNICGIGGWREEVEGQVPVDTPQQDDVTPGPCDSCVVDIVCKSECVEGEGVNFASTKEVKRDGVVDICIPNAPDNKQVLYLMMHELVHAQNTCAESHLDYLDHIEAGITNISTDPLQTTSEGTASGCCRKEFEEYRVQCILMAQDGILSHAGVSIDECASVLANNSCKQFDENPNDDNYVCTDGTINPEELRTAIGEATKALSDDLNLPETCAEALTDPRVTALYQSLPLSCAPGCEAYYDNTIGNNFCYASQCIEETHERSRTIPGRMGINATDQDFPWDAAAKEGSAILDLEVTPTLTTPRIPPYRPELLMKTMDDTLCQLNGLPALTPPVLCGVDPSIRIGLPSISIAENLIDLVSQPSDFDVQQQEYLYSFSAIGSGIASEIFALYLHTTAQQFAEILRQSQRLIQAISETELPSNMCPRISSGIL